MNTQEKENLELKANVERLLKANLCINPYCSNDGIVPTQDHDGDLVPEQCEFCYREPESLFNIRNQTPKQSLEAYRNSVIDTHVAICSKHKDKYLVLAKQAVADCKCMHECDCGEYEQGHVTAANMIIKKLKDKGGEL